MTNQRCIAKTKEGKRCKLQSKKKSKYCFVHIHNHKQSKKNKKRKRKHKQSKINPDPFDLDIFDQKEGELLVSTAILDQYLPKQTFEPKPKPKPKQTTTEYQQQYQRPKENIDIDFDDATHLYPTGPPIIERFTETLSNIITDTKNTIVDTTSNIYNNLFGEQRPQIDAPTPSIDRPSAPPIIIVPPPAPEPKPKPKPIIIEPVKPTPQDEDESSTVPLPQLDEFEIHDEEIEPEEYDGLPPWDVNDIKNMPQEYLPGGMSPEQLEFYLFDWHNLPDEKRPEDTTVKDGVPESEWEFERRQKRKYKIMFNAYKYYARYVRDHPPIETAPPPTVAPSERLEKTIKINPDLVDMLHSLQNGELDKVNQITKKVRMDLSEQLKEQVIDDMNAFLWYNIEKTDDNKRVVNHYYGAIKFFFTTPIRNFLRELDRIYNKIGYGGTQYNSHPFEEFGEQIIPYLVRNLIYFGESRGFQMDKEYNAYVVDHWVYSMWKFNQIANWVLSKEGWDTCSTYFGYIAPAILMYWKYIQARRAMGPQPYAGPFNGGGPPPPPFPPGGGPGGFPGGPGGGDFPGDVGPPTNKFISSFLSANNLLSTRTDLDDYWENRHLYDGFGDYLRRDQSTFDTDGTQPIDYRLQSGLDDQDLLNRIQYHTRTWMDLMFRDLQNQEPLLVSYQDMPPPPVAIGDMTDNDLYDWIQRYMEREFDNTQINIIGASTDTTDPSRPQRLLNTDINEDLKDDVDENEQPYIPPIHNPNEERVDAEEVDDNIIFPDDNQIAEWDNQIRDNIPPLTNEEWDTHISDRYPEFDEEQQNFNEYLVPNFADNIVSNRFGDWNIDAFGFDNNNDEDDDKQIEITNEQLQNQDTPGYAPNRGNNLWMDNYFARNNLIAQQWEQQNIEDIYEDIEDDAESELDEIDNENDNILNQALADAQDIIDEQKQSEQPQPQSTDLSGHLQVTDPVDIAAQDVQQGMNMLLQQQYVLVYTHQPHVIPVQLNDEQKQAHEYPPIPTGDTDDEENDDDDEFDPFAHPEFEKHRKRNKDNDDDF